VEDGIVGEVVMKVVGSWGFGCCGYVLLLMIDVKM
jgi:hypothetical protein